MRNLGLSAAVILSAAVFVTPVLAMGGGGSIGGGGYGGGMTSSAPTYSDYQIAVRLIRHQQYAEAIPHLESALANKPHDADVLNYLGYTKRMTGQYEASLDFYKRALAEDPNHKGVHEYLGELYLQMHDQTSAQKELDTLASLCPSGCDERDALTKALSAYTPPAPAPSALATPPAAAGPARAP